MNIRNPDYRIHTYVLLAGLLLLLAGCGISKPFPEKGLYAIDAGAPDQHQLTAQPSGSTSQAVLQVPQLRIATPYDSNSFIYRVGPEKYTTDYYNGFIASPASLLTGQLVSYLGHTGLYRYVVDGNSSIDYSLILEGNVTELYGDYSRPKAPQAVIAIHFFLLRPSGDGLLVLHDKLYRAAQPANGDKPDALVQAWGSAYRQIMQDLTSDLRTIGASPAPQASARESNVTDCQTQTVDPY